MLFPFPVAHFGGAGGPAPPPEDTWTERDIGAAAPFFAALDFAYGAGLYVVCGYSSNVNEYGRVFTSPDLVTWTERALPANMSTPGSGPCWRVIFAEGLFVLCGSGGNYGTGTQEAALATSPDAITWTSRASTIDGEDIKAILYDGTDFMIFGEDGETATSVVGTSWSAGVSLPAFFSPRDAVYDSNNSLYVVCGFPSGGDILITSPDKSVWTTRTLDSIAQPYGLAFDATLGLVCGGRTSGLDPKMNKSSNGTTWNAVTTPVDALSGDNSFWRESCIKFGNSKFVALVQNTGTGAAVMVKSADATNWYYSESTPISGQLIGGLGFGNGVFAACPGTSSIWTTT